MFFSLFFFFFQLLIVQLIASHLSYHYVCLRPGPRPQRVGCGHLQASHSNKNVLEFTDLSPRLQQALAVSRSCQTLAWLKWVWERVQVC